MFIFFGCLNLNGMEKETGSSGTSDDWTTWGSRIDDIPDPTIYNVENRFIADHQVFTLDKPKGLWGAAGELAWSLLCQRAINRVLDNVEFASIYGLLYTCDLAKQGYHITCNTRQLHIRESKLTAKELKKVTRNNEITLELRKLLDTQFMYERMRGKNSNKESLTETKNKIKKFQEKERKNDKSLEEIRKEKKEIRKTIKTRESNPFFKGYPNNVLLTIDSVAKSTGRTIGLLSIPFSCAQCDKEFKEISEKIKGIRCSHCKTAWYCSIEHAQKHAQEHLKTCISAKKENESEALNNATNKLEEYNEDNDENATSTNAVTVKNDTTSNDSLFDRFGFNRLWATRSKQLQELQTIQESATDNIHSCAVCSQDTMHRCIKCQSTWYCSKSCQDDDWPQHKHECGTSADHQEDEAETSNAENKLSNLNDGQIPAAQGNAINKLHRTGIIVE